MKRYSVYITQTAIDDMTELACYISKDLLQPDAADKMLNKLEEKIYTLDTMPLIYPLVPDKYLSELGIRKLPVENYIIFYTVSDDETAKVNIVRVLYQKRNWIDLI